MSDISDLEARITAALERIGRGLENRSESATPIDHSGLETALEEEKTANAQLVERVKALKERQDTKIAELESRVAAQADQMANLDGELQKLRASNADLRDLNAQLRSAAADGSTDPELINRALIAEVDALKAQRNADATEVDAILNELKPLIQETTNAAS